MAIPASNARCSYLFSILILADAKHVQLELGTFKTINVHERQLNDMFSINIIKKIFEFFYYFNQFPSHEWLFWLITLLF
jgi:hypothetical protein